MAYTDIPSIYQDILNRAPDDAGLQYYQNMVNQGTSLDDIANILKDSPEYRVIGAYQDVLNRAPDPWGLEFYQNMLNQGTSLDEIKNILLDSPEYRGMPFKSPYYNNQTLSAQDALSSGLGAAQVAMQNMANQTWTYPQYQEYQAPVQMGYTQYQAPQYQAPPQYQTPQYQAPPQYQTARYQTLSGGDYDALEAALYKGGATEADAQYRQGQRDIANVMGGRGLYGSSLMGTQMQDLSQQAADTKAKLGAEAARSRYGLQSAELGRMNQLSQSDVQQRNQLSHSDVQQRNQLTHSDVQQRNQLSHSDAAQYNQLTQSDAERYNQFLQNKLAWDYAQSNLPVQYQNLESDRKQQYELDAQNYRQNMINQLFNMGIGLSGGSSSVVNQNAGLSAQKAAQDAASQQALWTGISSGLLAGFTPSASGDTAFGKMYDSVTGWF